MNFSFTDTDELCESSTDRFEVFSDLFIYLDDLTIYSKRGYECHINSAFQE